MQNIFSSPLLNSMKTFSIDRQWVLDYSVLRCLIHRIYVSPFSKLSMNFRSKTLKCDIRRTLFIHPKYSLKRTSLTFQEIRQFSFITSFLYEKIYPKSLSNFKKLYKKKITNFVSKCGFSHKTCQIFGFFFLFFSNKKKV